MLIPAFFKKTFPSADYNSVKYSLLCLFIFFSLNLLSAQDTSLFDYAEVTGQYRSLFLGMNMEDVKEALSTDNYFDYRGEVDVTMFNDPNENIIDCRGSGFITRAWFQFRDDKLFVMELELDRMKIDYFTVYGQLSKKYGEPDDMTPQYATWSGDGVELSLEYPLTIKYLDRSVFDASLENNQINKTYRERTRQDFVEEF